MKPTRISFRSSDLKLLAAIRRGEKNPIGISNLRMWPSRQLKSVRKNIARSCKRFMCFKILKNRLDLKQFSKYSDLTNLSSTPINFSASVWYKNELSDLSRYSFFFFSFHSIDPGRKKNRINFLLDNKNR